MEDFVVRFDAVLHGFWEPHPRPTAASLARISAHFNIELPQELVQLATHSEKFSDLFLSFGENYRDHDHVISYNHYWRRRRRTRKLPSDLVIVTNGFMDEDFWCLIRCVGASKSSILGVEYWSPAPIGFPNDTHRGPMYPTFSTFLSMLISHYFKR